MTSFRDPASRAKMTLSGGGGWGGGGWGGGGHADSTRMPPDQKSKQSRVTNLYL
jgi:hypothetical protein